MSIGPQLKQAREAAGLSLQDVSASTRVRQTVISALERDDFSLCGGEAYARGHIRTLARLVGLDPEPLIAEFDAQYGNPALDDFAESTPIVLSRPRKSPWRPAMAVAGVALFVVAGVAVVQGDSQDQIANPGQTATPSNTPEPTTNTPSDDGATVADARDGVSFAVTATRGSSWVSISDSTGAELYQGILRPGDSRSFEDETNLRVVIGNAGAVDIAVNGRDLGPAGANGAVVRFNLVPGDPGIG